MGTVKSKPTIAWFSGGVTSAAACYLEVLAGKEARVLFIDTRNEHPDTYRFIADCEEWYNCEIEVISNSKYDTIHDVWHDFLSLNTAKGAICSSELKRAVRIDFQKRNEYSTQVFGFDASEQTRADNLLSN